MRDPFTFIERRAQEFGNHFHKYLWFIRNHRDNLIEHLEQKGVLDKVILYKPAHDLNYEMDTIISLTSDRDMQLDFLATYYSLQYTILNIRCVDILRMSLLSGQNQSDSYRDFMKQVGRAFRKLTACYMEKLLNLGINQDEVGDFIVLGVGTRADQDDIDIGIIDSGEHGREKLNVGVGKVVQEMMKRACYLHFHISEHVGKQAFSASIDEYIELLDDQIQDFIIINEMLNAWPIFGSWQLFRNFQQKVIKRYFYHKGERNKYHEGFLRGLLGEIVSLRIMRFKEDRLHPKEDALRIIKGLMSVCKTILNIEQIGSWDVITLLKEHATPHRKQFEILERSLIFIETFRFLYQLFICQSEDIYLHDSNDWKNVNIVAETMGFRNMGVIKASNHLLIAYHQHVQQVHNVVDELLPWIRNHLKQCSSLVDELIPILPQDDDGGEDRAIAGPAERTVAVQRFTQQLSFFHGIQFWDDILSFFVTDSTELLRIFVKEILDMPAEEQDFIIRRYAACGYYTSIPMITVIVLLAENLYTWDCESLFKRLSLEFLRTLRKLPIADERLIKIFNYKPILLNEFFARIPRENVQLLVDILDSRHWDDHIIRDKKRLLRLLILHKLSSRHFYRFLQKMIQRHPEIIKFLDRSEKVNMVSMGILGKVEETVSFKAKKEQLGDFYDMEYLRVGIQTLLGEHITYTNAQFTSFVDDYLQMLFHTCKQEVDFNLGKRTPTSDLLAVFSSGGHAREQAFDNDYDIIVMLNSDDQTILDYAMKIISKMNSEIVKRATLPHYRFADHFGKYVTTFSEMKEFLSANEETTFIEKSQILGCRLIVGSKKFNDDFMKEIVNPYILDKKDEFIISMIEEYRSRHRGSTESDPVEENGLDVKDCRGGLRDLEMLLMIYKAHFRIKKNISEELFTILKKHDPQHREEIEYLRETFHTLAHLRDLYRLIVTADDRIIWEELEEPLQLLRTAHLSWNIETLNEKRKRAYTVTAKASEIIDELMELFYRKANHHG